MTASDRLFICNTGGGILGIFHKKRLAEIWKILDFFLNLCYTFSTTTRTLTDGYVNILEKESITS